MEDKIHLPETGGLAAMAQTTWGRMYILVGALNVAWFFGAQFFIYQVSYDTLDRLLISVLIILPSVFVFGRAFVLGNAGLGLGSVFGLLVVALALFLLAEEYVIFKPTFYFFDPDRTVFTASGPIFALVYVVASRFANPGTIEQKPKARTMAVSPSVWGGSWRHAAAFLLALLVSNLAQRFVASSVDQYFFGSVDLPSKEGDVILSGLSAAIILFVSQTVFFGMIYKLVGRIHPVRAIPAIVVISVLGILSTYGDVYALSIANEDSTETASDFGFSWAAMQALSAIAFVICFGFMFRKRRIGTISISVPQAPS